MDQDRWKTVNQIFHAAREVSSDERPAFVETASSGDPDLQADVDQPLQADQDAGSYLESPAIPAALSPNSASPVNSGDFLCGRFRVLLIRPALGDHPKAAIDDQVKSGHRGRA
jgi:hypothetical protein